MTLSPGASNIPTAASVGFHFQRHEKVVLVVDLVESVTLMQTDELGIIQRWDAFLRHVTQSVLPANEGHLVKSLGDGLMVEFDSAPRAAASAMAMHRWLDAQHRDTDRGRMQLRIGLHATYVYEGEHDIYGTGVNLAARIASLAQPGQTVATASARDGLVDGLDGDIEDLGNWYLKHVNEPLHVYGIRAAGQVAPAWTPRTNAPSLRPTIAVLPFVSRTVQAEQYSLGDLIAEGVIGQLSRSQELKVISHLSTSAFRGRAGNLDDAKAYLGAQFVLSGSYVITGKTVLVMAEFTHVERNEFAWAERVTGDVEDLVQMHSEICATIANGCHRALLDSEAHEALVRPLPSLQSYTMLLGSIGLMHRSASSQFLRTREVLDALIERHGQCALPRVWLAKWYVLCSTRGLTDDAKSQANFALQETRRALDLEPGNPLAWAVQGFVYCHLMKDVERALQSCSQALEWNSNESLAWLFKAMVHAFDGNGAEALPAGLRALELSPLDPLKYYYNSLMASIAISAERYDLAISHAEQSLRVNASHLSSYRSLIIAQSLAGLPDAARQTLAQLMLRDPQFSVSRFAQGYPSRERVPAYLEKLKDALRAAGAKES